jgi:hypothetical protein
MKCVRRKFVSRFLAGSIALGFAVLPAVVLLMPQPADGTEELMKTLPAYERYRCGLCHTSATPTQEANKLNVFGTDFLGNSSVWDRTIALLNSDGDRCSNGAEIGDRDGDGDFDDGGPKPRENSNPGNPADCTAPIDEATWGIIKEIFSNELKEYNFEEPEYEFFTMYFGP